MEDLQNLKYKALQKLAKAAGIIAKAPKADLVNALIAYNNNEDEKKPEDSSIKTTTKGDHLISRKSSSSQIAWPSEGVIPG